MLHTVLNLETNVPINLGPFSRASEKELDLDEAVGEFFYLFFIIFFLS